MSNKVLDNMTMKEAYELGCGPFGEYTTAYGIFANKYKNSYLNGPYGDNLFVVCGQKHEIDEVIDSFNNIWNTKTLSKAIGQSMYELSVNVGDMSFKEYIQTIDSFVQKTC